MEESSLERLDFPPQSVLRREFLGALSLAIGALAVGGPRFTSAQSLRAPDPSAAVRHLPAILDRISDALIPGSASQRVGEFLAGVLDYEFRGLTRDQVTTVLAALQGRSTAASCNETDAQCSTLVASLDADVYAGKCDASTAAAWKALKLAVLSVYYTTEKGASQDLLYVAVPGRWEPDVSVAEYPTALWNDLWARTFT